MPPDFCLVSGSDAIFMAVAVAVAVPVINNFLKSAVIIIYMHIICFHDIMFMLYIIARKTTAFVVM